jgi:8-oxo-dGTP pyrophosphatase MutT (NUDIX family)
MSYLRHLASCNRFDPDAFLPFHLADGARIGFVRHDHVAALDRFPQVFEIGAGAVGLKPGLGDEEAISAAFADIGRSLAESGLAPALRHEDFDASLAWGGPVQFRLDRAIVPFFGIRGYGCHLNGFLQRDGALQLWVGRRAADKKIAPNKLDNIVAGGVSAGYGAGETLVKEAEEEAAMPADLAGRARPVGAILYRFQVPEGMRDDVLFLYDLEVPASFQPQNTDGEFAEFMVLPAAECLRRVAETDEFKFNVNLVLIDFALRHGLIGPEHPDYLDLVAGLRGGLIQGLR